MELTVDDLCEAINIVREGTWDVTIGNISDQLGLGSGNEDCARVHDLLAKALRELRVSYTGSGEYTTGPLYSSEPVEGKDFLDDREPWEANEGIRLVPDCADISYHEIVDEVLGEFLECEPLGQPTE